MKWTVARDIADRIRRIREILGSDPGAPLPQAELARRAGVRPSQVSQWERGVQRPSRNRLERWADREGWPITVFAEAGPPPSHVVLGGVPGPAASAPADHAEADGTGDQPDVDDLLARFYRLMAEAAERGRPFPPELAQLMDGLYRAATARRGTVPAW